MLTSSGDVTLNIPCNVTLGFIFFKKNETRCPAIPPDVGAVGEGGIAQVRRLYTPLIPEPGTATFDVDELAL